MMHRPAFRLSCFFAVTACLGVAALLVSGCSRGVAASADSLGTTVFVVRHAQKVDPNDNTPGALLSEEGRASARRLADSLRSTNIEAVFATPTVRARDTALPTATFFGLQVTEYDPAALVQLVDHIRGELSGRACLVVGHSNTVPAIVRALGGDAGGNLASDAYDNLFIVCSAEAGGSRKVTTIRIHLSQ